MSCDICDCEDHPNRPCKTCKNCIGHFKSEADYNEIHYESIDKDGVVQKIDYEEELSEEGRLYGHRY